MLEVDWTEEGGWQRPVIRPLAPLQIHPAAKVLHYATEVSVTLPLEPFLHVEFYIFYTLE